MEARDLDSGLQFNTEFVKSFLMTELIFSRRSRRAAQHFSVRTERLICERSHRINHHQSDNSASEMQDCGSLPSCSWTFFWVSEERAVRPVGSPLKLAVDLEKYIQLNYFFFLSFVYLCAHMQTKLHEGLATWLVAATVRCLFIYICIYFSVYFPLMCPRGL